MTSHRSNRPLLLVLLLGVLLHAPSLAWDFLADDYGHELALAGEIEHVTMRPWALYDFGSLAEQPELRDAEGALPYWTPPEWRVRFLRPLPSLVRWFEHTTTGGSALGAHAFGLVWWVVLLGLCWRLFGALGLAPRAALWALAFLALQNGNVMSVGWPANRNSVIEALFLVASVLVFAEATSTRARLAALGLGVCAVLSKESGVAVFALLAGLAWLRRGQVPNARAWMAASVACAAGYLACYLGSGYGANSLFYPTPWGEPVVWLARLAVLVPGMAVTAATPFPTDIVQVAPNCVSGIVLAGLGLLVVLGRSLRRTPHATGMGALLLFWLVVTIVPQAGAPLSDRLFLVPGIAVAALFGAFVADVNERSGLATLVERRVRSFLVVSAGALSGVALVAIGINFVSVSRFTGEAVEFAEVGEVTLGRRDVIVLQAPSQLVALQPLTAYLARTQEVGVRFWPLSFTRDAVRLTRTGDRSFELESLGRPFFSGPFASVFLGPTTEVSVGDRWTTDLLEVRALAVTRGRPTRVAVDVPRSLDDPTLRLLRWRPPFEGERGHGRWAHLPAPTIGGSVTILEPPAPLPFLP